MYVNPGEKKKIVSGNLGFLYMKSGMGVWNYDGRGK